MSAQREPKKFVVSWTEFHRDTKALAWKLQEKSKEWKGVLSITRGGMIPAAIVASELDIKLIETIGISSYDEKNQRSLEVIKNYNENILDDGSGWLVIDDLVDSGNTAKIIKNRLPNAHIATVYAKPAGEPLTDTYVTSVSQDTWIYFPWEVYTD